MEKKKRKNSPGDIYNILLFLVTFSGIYIHVELAAILCVVKTALKFQISDKYIAISLHVIIMKNLALFFPL